MKQMRPPTVFFFFFSSRRRHTRSLRDWSSDVCSSDLVAGGVPPAGLRVVYGDTVTASGAPSRGDRPTVLCLMGFGSAVLPRAIYEPFAALAGSRASIHTASARLFVFSTADIGRTETPAPDVAITGEGPAAYAPVRHDADTGEVEQEEPAQTDEELSPSASDQSPAER